MQPGFPRVPQGRLLSFVGKKNHLDDRSRKATEIRGRFTAVAIDHRLTELNISISDRPSDELFFEFDQSS